MNEENDYKSLPHVTSDLNFQATQTQAVHLWDGTERKQSNLTQNMQRWTGETHCAIYIILNFFCMINLNF